MFLKNFQSLQETFVLQSHFNKVLNLQAYNFINKSCFPVNFAKYLTAPILQNTSAATLLLQRGRKSDHFILLFKSRSEENSVKKSCEKLPVNMKYDDLMLNALFLAKSCAFIQAFNQHVTRRTEAVTQKCFVKKPFLKISQNSKESTYARVSFLIKLQPETCNFIKKEILAQVFSCEFCEIFNNTFFYRTPPVAATRRNNNLYI